jgi:hypothetical protein
MAVNMQLQSIARLMMIRAAAAVSVTLAVYTVHARVHRTLWIGMANLAAAAAAAAAAAVEA